MNHGCTIMSRKKKQQSSQWKTPSSPRPKNCATFAATSTCFFFFLSFFLFFFFFFFFGIVHKEFVPSGQTVNRKFYCEVLRRQREDVRCKRSEMWKNGDWLLHHDNAPAYTSLVVKESRQKIKWSLFPSLPTHLTWPPALFTCSLKWKFRLKGRPFVSTEEIQAESQQVLYTLKLAYFN